MTYDPHSDHPANVLLRDILAAGGFRTPVVPPVAEEMAELGFGSADIREELERRGLTETPRACWQCFRPMEVTRGLGELPLYCPACEAGRPR